MARSEHASRKPKSLRVSLVLGAAALCGCGSKHAAGSQQDDAGATQEGADVAVGQATDGVIVVAPSIDSAAAGNDPRGQAAAATANSSAACLGIQPFYWEIGSREGKLAGGTASQAGATTPAASTQMLIASSSKWIFGAYVVERRAGQLTANDLAALTMRSGYTGLRYASCIKLLRANQDAETVHDCFVANNLTGANSDFDAAAVGKFHYNGGHFQWLADGDLGLGTTNNASLQSAVAAQVGTDFVFTYDSPQLAGGIQSSGADYAIFLRRILAGGLHIHDLLGSNAVCTNPSTCPDAEYTPIPSSESWHYSLGHWVEDDPVAGDGAFSSPGAFGFYPWIDGGKTTYGVLARHASVTLSGNDPVAVESVVCGRLIRKAWFTGVAQ
jgi:hypothetical protein